MILQQVLSALDNLFTEIYISQDKAGVSAAHSVGHNGIGYSKDLLLDNLVHNLTKKNFNLTL